jgi:hypothetical protein
MNGQIAIEFMIFVSILLVITTIAVFSNISLNQGMSSIKSDEEAKKLCERIAFEINSAVRIGDSYKRNFYIESPFGISDFNISAEAYSVFIDWDEKSVACAIATNNITGKIEKGWNLIENIGGVIYVY